MGSVLPLLPAWSPPKSQIAPECGAVDVWCFALDNDAPSEPELWSVLSQEERDRAARFRFAADRLRFMAARGLLRGILAGILGALPEQLQFTYNAFGKPALAQRPKGVELQFNVSHSHDVVLIAVAAAHEIGVDVERIDRDLDIDAVGAQVFTYEEQEALQRLEPRERQIGFFTFWTCKEAVIKAVGTGFSLAPNRFTVLPAEGRVRDDHTDARAWNVSALRLKPLELFPGYAAALAQPEAIGDVRVWSRGNPPELGGRGAHR